MEYRQILMQNHHHYFYLQNVIKRVINILHQPIFYYFNIEERVHLKNYIANMRYKFYWPNVKMKEMTLNVQGERLSVNMVNDSISSFELYFTLMSFISVIVESI